MAVAPMPLPSATADSVPSSAAALRPTERRYALFRVIPPRRRLIRLDDQRWAAVPIQSPESEVAVLDVAPPWRGASGAIESMPSLQALAAPESDSTIPRTKGGL